MGQEAEAVLHAAGAAGTGATNRPVFRMRADKRAPTRTAVGVNFRSFATSATTFTFVASRITLNAIPMTETFVLISNCHWKERAPAAPVARNLTMCVPP